MSSSSHALSIDLFASLYLRLFPSSITPGKSLKLHAVSAQICF